MHLSQADSSSTGIVSFLLAAIWVCVLIGILIAMRWGIKRLDTLLSGATGPWAWGGGILLVALRLAFVLCVLGVSALIFSLIIG
ncbi:hypothetical protein AB0F44_28360 [Nocardioides sp. NPDC023903]|uniref:hypothetical protein n=1 Tax=Nocardioides sp. NPDC023903 TaxID=3157195 RepID=UPI0033C31A9D